MGNFLNKYKYEVLLGGLAQHLFIGIFLADTGLYTRMIWSINMLVVGITTVGTFTDKSTWRNYTRIVLFTISFALPLIYALNGTFPYFLEVVSATYFLYFLLIFWEVIRFLIKPSYINTDIIVAALCGFFLMIELNVFFIQFLYYLNPDSIAHIDPTNPATVYIDLVYFSSIIQTTIGFGDILPTTPNTKLATALFGILGQFYSVVLVGILLSKFTQGASSSP